jgi:hypothetical protein
MAYNAAAVTDAVIAYQKPITLQQGRALRDNPLAIAAGTPPAPRISPLAFDGSRILPMLSTTGASIIDLGDVAVLEMLLYFDMSGGTNTMDVRFSTDNGGSWGSYQSFHTSGAEAWRRMGRINLVTGAYLIGAATGTLTVPANVNAVSFRTTGGGTGYELTPMIGGGRS